MQSITTARGTIAYDAHITAPDAPTIIYLHGAGGMRTAFSEDMLHLPGWNGIRLDLPNHGNSEFVGLSRYDRMQAYRDDLIAFMDTLAIKRAVICGHSMSCGIALLLAMDCAERTDGIILANGAANMRIQPRMVAAFVDEVRRGVDDILALTLKPLVRFGVIDTSDPDNERGYLQFLRLNPRVLLKDYWLCHTFNVNDRLSEVTVPTLLMSGELDNIYTPHQNELMEDRLPNARHIFFENTGHFIPGEKPAQFIAAVQTWLADQLPARVVATA